MRGGAGHRTAPVDDAAEGDQRPAGLEQPGDEHGDGDGVDVAPHGEAGRDDAEVEEDRRARGRREAAVRLQETAEQRDGTDQRHVGEHDHGKAERQPTRLAERCLEEREEDQFTGDDEGRERGHGREHDGPCEALCLLGIFLLEAGVGGDERGGERALAEETAEEVGDEECECERGPLGARAEDARADHVADEPHDAADEGETGHDLGARDETPFFRGGSRWHGGTSLCATGAGPRHPSPSIVAGAGIPARRGRSASPPADSRRNRSRPPSG
jgi:hypothetical protein